MERCILNNGSMSKREKREIERLCEMERENENDKSKFFAF
jgi:hypothetical protein